MEPFLTRLRKALAVPVTILSTGRARSETVFLEPFRSLVEGAL